MLKDIYSLLVEYVPQSIVSKDEPMSAHTSFKIGGNADFLVQPGSKEDFVSVMACCKANDIPFTVIGNGSNLLVSDKGIRGVVIKVGKNFSNIYMLDDGIIYAESGASLASVAAFALKNQLTGFEFASGIPGTVGGAMLMNAGAYGGEIKDVAVFGDVLGYDGTFCRIEGENQNFGYRKSGYQDNDCIILGAGFKLEKTDNCDLIRDRMYELNMKRKEKQPLEFGSAGSTFKRPEGYFAGKLIEDCGLKGFSVGGAQVSEKHAGFVINRSGASASDVISLMKHIRKVVYDKYGVMLETEVKIIGEDISF